MPEVVRICDYHRLDRPAGAQMPCTILNFPHDRIVRWPEQRLPVVIVVPSLMPPFFQVIEGRL